MQRRDPIELNFEGLEWNKPKDRPQEVDGGNGAICLVIMFTSRVMAFKMSEMAIFLFFPDNIKKLVTVWAISLSKRGRSHQFLAEDGMFNRPWT